MNTRSGGEGVRSKKVNAKVVSCAVPMSTVVTSAMSLAVNLEPIWSTCKKDAFYHWSICNTQQIFARSKACRKIKNTYILTFSATS
jgi:hypothetical protein